ncbi:diphthine synthase [Candidatus Woesearchaeota archaeon CG10_big_fil_rev_8_21_14_0_10_32_24]|nr:MAG: diphthine synthase [Candidatus Woesearchaeota archaeon CG10_big_fil_rev_8_21_14_0_10_32_24]
MTLYIIGLGLNGPKDITMKGLELVKSCDEVYLERYTSLLQCSFHDLAKFYDKEITLADRNTSEQGMEKIVKQAKTENVAFLVIGDPFSATTHTAIFKMAKENDVNVEVIHNSSILTAIGQTGLQLYKFGKTTSIPFLDDFPQLETPYRILQQNQEIGAHTLMLLDIRVDQDQFMTVSQAIEILENIESRIGEKAINDEILAIGCARLGCDDFIIKTGTLKHLKDIDFGKPLHCLIIPGKMHFSEEEIIKMWT